MADLKTLPLLLLSTMLAVPANALPIAPPKNQGRWVWMDTSYPRSRFDTSDLFRAGIDSLLAHRFADASVRFAQILRRSPDDPYAHYLAGIAHAGIGDLRGAQHSYEQALHFDGGLVIARRELALVNLKLDDRSGAEAQLEALTIRQARCHGKCGKAAQIDSAVKTVRAAIESETSGPAGMDPLLASEIGPWVEPGLAPAS